MHINSSQSQEQLRRRQEDQDRVNNQHEFMRASLRESKKLLALQSNRLPERPAGFENTAFADDEDVENARGIYTWAGF